ncbi:MAG: DUF445 domain-containing protein [Actinomycetales bacterium]|uniref:DUF445 domain-containing protein n=1 Tax=Candidatus Phosphoribacter hodrii TaxID=2953743 RepID=A0A9D7TA66_9MICO|nr:DUF445 domain-containing protein [Candidatus Phosphoribacter hodrii]
MTSVSVVTDTMGDEQRRRGLRQMRTVALGLLLFAAVVYVLTLGKDGAWGFVNAGAEASMVGAIADWFAVTALFRHPMGLPIPHTALIPKKKDMLARSLQDFMGDNFLREEIIRDRVLAAHISARAAAWALVPANSLRATNEVVGVTIAALNRLSDASVTGLLDEAVLPRLREEPIAPIAGTFLGEVVRDRAHHGLVDLAVSEAHRWLLANEETFAAVLEERAPWWAPTRVNEMVIKRLHVEALAWVEDIRDNPHHHARVALDDLLTQLADDLQHDPETMERAERIKVRVLDHPQLQTATSLWAAFRTALITSLGRASRRCARGSRGSCERSPSTCATRPLQARLDGYAADLATYFVDRYGDELMTVISHTIERWDGQETAEKVELHVGRDLQFIRINGTIVGGLVGVLIHAVSLLLGR